jgi:hypothetical protein
MYLSRRALVIAGAATILLGGGTAALAATSSSPVQNGVVHGCYASAGTSGSHPLVLQNVGTACPNGDTAIKWNQKGPAGSPGPAGPVGPQGPQGPAGSLSSNVDYGTLDVSVNGNNPTCTLDQTGGPDSLTAVETDLEGWIYYQGPTCQITGFPGGAVPIITGLDGYSGNPPWVHFTGGGIWISATASPQSGHNWVSFMIIDPSS